MLKLYLSLAACLTTLCATAAPCAMRYTFEQWPPYMYVDDNAHVTGLDVALTEAIFREADCALVRTDALPLRRRELMFAQGRIDLMLARTETTDRQRLARFSLPYRDEVINLFSTPANLARMAHVDGFAALANGQWRLLAPEAGWYGQAYADAGAMLRSAGLLSTFASSDQAVRMLAAGRADLIMGDGAALRYAAHQAGIEIVALSYIVNRSAVHLMFNRTSTSEAQRARIDQAITRLEQRAVLQAIRAHYGATSSTAARPQHY